MNYRFPRDYALRIATDLADTLTPHSERIIIAGSLRRMKPTVGDIEILFIPKFEVRPDPDDMFASIRVNLVDEAIAHLEQDGTLKRRRNVNGSTMFGAKNKLMRHCATGIPVDLFAATPENWFNYLVCRTGPADSNTRICVAAQERGWKWNPYGTGFSRNSEVRDMQTEQEVFEFVGLPFLPPEKRT